MEEKVLLRLTGIQRDETGEETVTDLCVKALFYRRNNSTYILYEEAQEETGAVIKSTLKLKDRVLELVKTGTVRTRMVFRQGKECMTEYVTPYGCLQMGVRTDALSVSCEEDGRMKIRVEYALTSGGYPVSDCELTIQTIPVQTGH